MNNPILPVDLTEELEGVGMHVEPEETAIDVVCGMEVDSSRVTLKAEYRDEVYFFCSKTCRYHFVNDPEKYLG